MVLRKVGNSKTGENSDDLESWLAALSGCPPISHTALARCRNAVHGDEQPTWFFVEGDPQGGIARRRCLACGVVHHLLDSANQWTHPPMRVCGSCGQSMFELAVGMHIENGLVTWIAVGVRCVGCGLLEGLTDMRVPSLSIPEVADAI